jgi:tetratricopeptide (TPR) repeat protein
VPAFAVAILLVITAPASAQDIATYAMLVDRYAAGDQDNAPSQLGRWPRAEVTAAVDRWARTLTADQLRAAVMLHTDLAYVRMFEAQSGIASFQIDTASRPLRMMLARAPRDQSSRMFGGRWYAVIAGMYTAQGLLVAADYVVRDAMAAFPRTPELYVARGCIEEMRAIGAATDLTSAVMIGRPSRMLEAAAADYRRALDVDGTMAAAHLHLGWVHHMVGDNRALGDLDAALTHATDDGGRYLALLFRGGIAERVNRLEEARREYEAAKALGPYQTPFVALSRIEEALGHHTRARDIAREYTELGMQVEDPWWDYHHGGFDATGLAWLRGEARRR